MVPAIIGAPHGRAAGCWQSERRPPTATAAEVTLPRASHPSGRGRLRNDLVAKGAVPPDVIAGRLTQERSALERPVELMLRQHSSASCGEDRDVLDPPGVAAVD
jgi:hypothetical protein